MAWTTVSTPVTWNVTDLELIKRMQYMLLEASNGADADGATLLTDQFGFQEILDNMNLAQESFFRDTGCIMARATQGSTPGQTRYALPPDWIRTRRLTWVAQIAGSKISALASTDAYALDHGMLDWQQNSDTPTVYNQSSNLPTLTVEILKAPSQAGTMGLHYIPQPRTLTGLGVNLDCPDEMESAVLYGTLASLLSSDGPGQDIPRATYCQFRYDLAVDLAKALIEGAAPIPAAAAGGGQ